jgi:hypothetical protein
MTMREVGTCRNDPWEDGYCSDDCREQATRCTVPFCGCAGRCGTGERPPTREELA